MTSINSMNLSCLYCGQHIKRSRQSAFHEQCKKIYFKKVGAARTHASREFPHISVFRCGKPTKISVCNECGFEVGEQEIQVAYNLAQEKQYNAVDGMCVQCINRAIKIGDIERDKQQFRHEVNVMPQRTHAKFAKEKREAAKWM